MPVRPAPWPPLPTRREVQRGLAAALSAWQLTPPAASTTGSPTRPGPVPEATRATLEAFAATVVPQDAPEPPDARARAAREAVALLAAPEAASHPYLPAVAALLDAHATAFAAREDDAAEPDTTSSFAGLDETRRSALCADLLAPGVLDDGEQQVLTLLSLLVLTASHHAGRRPVTTPDPAPAGHA